MYSGHSILTDNYISVWDLKTLSEVQRLNCGPVNGVSAIAFNPTGQYVIAATQVVRFDRHFN